MQYVLLPEGHAVLVEIVVTASTVPPTFILMGGKFKLKKMFFFYIFYNHIHPA